MRRFSLGAALVALPAFALSLILAGCGNKDTGSSGGGGSGEVTQTQKPSGPAKELEPKGGVLKGKITLTSKPNVDSLSERLKAEIDKSSQKTFCLKGTPEEIAEQEYRIGKNGNLGNVFVWILPPDDNAIFKVDKETLDKAKNNPVKIRQPHCAFIPHCAVAWVEYHSNPKKAKDKEPTGQYIEVVNDATESHNTNYSASRNPSGNPTLPPGKSEKIQKLHAVGDPMTLKCNIHTWMKGYVRLLDTPYYAISYSDTLDGKDKVEDGDPKFGTFVIKNLPVGKMRVIAWHEACGYLNKEKGKGDEIEIAEGKETEKNFEAAPQ
jgi:hypothetical protein